MPIKILYIHTAGAFGGASRSLMELIGAFCHGSVESSILLPKGSAVTVLASISERTITTTGIPQFDNTRFGFYRGLRWLILLREILYLPFFVTCLLKARREWGHISLIHVNEITAIIPALLAKRVFHVPVVMHVRSVQAEQLKTPLRSRLISDLLNKYVDVVIAIDETVKTSLPQQKNVKVVHNSFSIDLAEDGGCSKRSSEENEKLKVAIVGGLLELKGVFDFLRAAKICLNKGLDVEFVIVGENVREAGSLKAFILEKLGFFKDVRSDCEAFICDNALEGKVSLVGFNFDIGSVYREIDLLCFPSHLEAVGRPVFEAAFFKVPSIVAITDPLPDTFIDGETGTAVTPKCPEELAKAIEYFYRHPEEIERMGANAYELAKKNFDSKRNAEKVLEIYRDVLSECAS